MSRRPSRRISKEEVKAVADRAAARAAGKDQDGADGRDAQKLITDAITEGELNAEIAKLAQLPPALYEHCRKDEAVRLRLRTSVLDKLVQAAWTKTKRTGTTVLGDGKIEDGHVVLDAVEKFLGRFISYPSEHARVAHALWIAHASNGLLAHHATACVHVSRAAKRKEPCT
jgi:hypothetical protein